MLPSSVLTQKLSFSLEAYFFSVLSDYDEDRVYPSDIKKILNWYNLLNQHKLLDFKAETPVSVEEE